MRDLFKFLLLFVYVTTFIMAVLLCMHIVVTTFGTFIYIFSMPLERFMKVLAIATHTVLIEMLLGILSAAFSRYASNAFNYFESEISISDKEKLKRHNRYVKKGLSDKDGYAAMCVRDDNLYKYAFITALVVSIIGAIIVIVRTIAVIQVLPLLVE